MSEVRVLVGTRKGAFILPSDFGFVIDVHAHEPETICVVPIKSDSELPVEVQALP